MAREVKHCRHPKGSQVIYYLAGEVWRIQWCRKCGGMRVLGRGADEVWNLPDNVTAP